MPSSIPGQGFFITNRFFSSAATGLPLSSTTSASTPGNGNAAEPGQCKSGSHAGGQSQPHHCQSRLSKNYGLFLLILCVQKSSGCSFISASEPVRMVYLKARWQKWHAQLLTARIPTRYNSDTGINACMPHTSSAYWLISSREYIGRIIVSARLIPG